MQSMKKEQWRGRGRLRGAGLALLAAALTVSAGCSGGVKVKPDSAREGASGSKGYAVTRLSDGRDGFTITETASLDSDARRDFERAVALIKEGSHERAIELLEKVIEGAPGVAAPHVNAALAYGRSDRREKAEGHLKTALELVPGHPVASNEYGLLLRKGGRFEEAREVFEASLKRFPEYLPVRRNLGILCDLYLNDPACALEQYGLYSRALPGDDQVKIWIADLRIRIGSQQ